MNRSTGTYFGFINGLLSLIPIFPAWSIFPGAITAGILEKFIPCESSILMVGIMAFLISIIYAIAYYIKINQYESRNKENFKAQFRFFCLNQYILINTYLFISIVGINNCCYGDGQTAFGVIFSGPLASIMIFILGVIFDLVFRKRLSN
ncbi:hypothetical protein GXP67_17330 [Rhodocytophaga rosea]|uniref:Uncharacterized protein n=1 Tax=Rhodocytophaga rosea TaxID=2704465 RepID=A0A6C0GK02_9BACT|nr:hypothetical protein [Rhodocytophaga rosea]QHT68277.1 hypothetical protein GXP67_17330 [Rhodocytophaga rosea]